MTLPKNAQDRNQHPKNATIRVISIGATQLKNNFFFDFLKVYNELGKVKKFWTSRPLFSWRNSRLKKVRAHCAPHRTIRVKIQ